MKKFLVLFMIMLACCTLLAACAAKPAAPEPDEPSQAVVPAKIMIIGSVNARDRDLSQAFYKFEEYLEAELDGAIDVQVFTDGVLGDDRRTLEGLQMGTIHGSTVSTGPISAFYPDIALFDLPFLFKDRKTAYAVLDGPIGQELLDNLADVGFIGLCYWENGFRHLSNSKREITTLADIRGLKIRTMESPIHVDIWKALGANPTPMSFSQLYAALEQKVVDGQENPLANMVGNKLDEVQPYVTLTGHLYSASPFLVSKIFWDGLTAKEQEAIKKCALLAQADERALAAEADKAAITYLEEQGVLVSELDPGEKEKMYQAVQIIYENYGADFGADLLSKVRESL